MALFLSSRVPYQGLHEMSAHTDTAAPHPPPPAGHLPAKFHSWTPMDKGEAQREATHHPNLGVHIADRLVRMSDVEPSVAMACCATHASLASLRLNRDMHICRLTYRLKSAALPHSGSQAVSLWPPCLRYTA